MLSESIYGTQPPLMGKELCAFQFSKLDSGIFSYYFGNKLLQKLQLSFVFL